MPRTSNATAEKIDGARHAMCRHIQRWCEQGATNVKVRVNIAEDNPEAVWFYGHVNNKWVKLPETIDDSESAELIADELHRLAATPQSAEFQIRRKTAGDRVEFELKFPHDDIVSHQGKKFGSYLFGLLFHERRAPPNSLRQGVRRGPGKSQMTHA